MFQLIRLIFIPAKYLWENKNKEIYGRLIALVWLIFAVGITTWILVDINSFLQFIKNPPSSNNDLQKKSFILLALFLSLYILVFAFLHASLKWLIKNNLITWIMQDRLDDKKHG